MAFFPCSLEWAITIGELNGLYPDRCDFLEPPEADAGDFGEEPSGAYVASLTDEPCRFYPSKASMNESLTASQIQERGDFTALFRADLPRPSAKAKVHITSDGIVFNFEIAGFGDRSDKINTVIYLRRGNPPIIE